MASPQISDLSAPKTHSKSIKRSFTLPATLQSSAGKAGAHPKEAEPQSIETLFAHNNARIVYFTAPGTGTSPRDRRQSLQDSAASGNLAWRSPTESTVGVGGFRIYRVPGSVAFLNMGKDFLKPIMANSQCWCVDDMGIFVLKRFATEFYRIELPWENDEDKAVVGHFRQALGQVLKYEKTPCPFQREFHVELPESPEVTYVPWKPKHRPISPVRRPSTSGTSGTSPERRARRLLRSPTDATSSRDASPSSWSPTGRSYGSPSREYSASPLRELASPTSIRPTIGRFEVIDKDHQRDQLLARRRGRSPEASGQPQQLRAGAPSPLAIERSRSPNKMSSTRFSQVTRTVTAPPALLIKTFNQASVQENQVAGSLKNGSKQDSTTTTPTLTSTAEETLLPAESDSTAQDAIISATNDMIKAPETAPSDHSDVANWTERVTEQAEVPDDFEVATSQKAAPEYPNFEDLTLESDELHEDVSANHQVSVIELEPVPRTAEISLGQMPQSGHAGTEEHALSATSESIASYEHMVAEGSRPSSAPKHSGNTSPSTIGSLPDFGVDTTKPEEEPGPATLDSAGRSTSASIPGLEISQGVVTAATEASVERIESENALEVPDTPIWHSAGESTESSSANSHISTSTGQSFVTAPLIIRDDSHVTPSEAEVSNLLKTRLPRPSELQRSLSVRAQQRSRSRSPLPVMTNLYLPQQDSYEHIGAVIGEKMAGVLLGPPLQLAAMMLRIASRFTNGVRIRDEEGLGWERRGEKGRRLPGTFETYSEDEGDDGSEWEDDYGISIYGIEKEKEKVMDSKPESDNGL